MKLFVYILKTQKFLVFMSSLFGFLSGAANAAMIAMISNTIDGFQKGQVENFSAYLWIAVGSLAAGCIAQLFTVRLATKLTYLLRLRLCAQILKLPYRQVEKTGLARLMAAFTEDISSSTAALLNIPPLSINLAITLGCLSYLGFLSPFVLGIFMAFLVFSLISYWIPERASIGFMKQNRELWDRLLSQFNAMNKGMKELALHRGRRETFFRDYLATAAEDSRRASLKFRSIYAVMGTYTQFFYFIFIGILLFIVPRFQELDLKTITGFALVVLYIRGPIAALVGTIPTFRQADISLAKIKNLGLDVTSRNTEDPFYGQDSKLLNSSTMEKLSSFRFEGLTHTFYREREDSQFTLGPISFDVNAGELVFIIGGNGSGKTTLAKIIAGLYPPETGQILLNGKAVDSKGLEAYRQYFSAIFSDFFVFEQIMGLEQDALDDQAQTYLKKLQLDYKVKVTKGKLSSVDLSAGQRKRLALLTAYLEDRPVYIFDEWAADQDPEFKNVFYHELLPELKARGKTVFVISHDDRYFDVADRIVKLTDGQLSEIQAPGER